jgi:hypothetical protein
VRCRPTLDTGLPETEFPHELHAEQARLELDLYLRVWQSLHEWSAVEYVEKLSALARARSGPGYQWSIW